jgi:hypothetical protein
MFVHSASLNCREAGTATSPIVERLTLNDVVIVTGEHDGWYQLDRDQGCWVSGRFLGENRAHEPEPEPQRAEIRSFAAAPVARAGLESEFVSYANCSAARAAGAAPVRVGDPGYSRRLDRDGDGVGCE